MCKRLPYQRLWGWYRFSAINSQKKLNSLYIATQCWHFDKDCQLLSLLWVCGVWRTCTFDNWITLVYTKFKTWSNLQRYVWTNYVKHCILCRIIWEFCIWPMFKNNTLFNVNKIAIALFYFMLSFIITGM
jgi:hypothetical protein